MLTTAGFLSIPCRNLLPLEGLVWDSDNDHAVQINKLARAAARALFAEVPEFANRPTSPDARSRHSEDSYGTCDPRAPGGGSFIHFPPVETPLRGAIDRARAPHADSVIAVAIPVSAGAIMGMISC